MKATHINGGKVHEVTNGATRCGVGKGRKAVQWQMELGDVTCLRCVRLKQADERKEAQEAQEVLTADQRR